MPFVKRDKDNNIVGVFNLPQEDAREEISKNDVALQSFLDRPAPQSINKALEEAFLSVLPAHVGQPYLTAEVMLKIASLKQSVSDFNRLGLYGLSYQMIAGLSLPSEMEEDKLSLLALFPQP